MGEGRREEYYEVLGGRFPEDRKFTEEVKSKAGEETTAIIPSLFEAFLKCPTKCWLRATDESPSGNTYAEWVKTQNEFFRTTETERLLANASEDEPARWPSTENPKAGKWRLAVNMVAQATLPTPSGEASYAGPTNSGSSINPTDSWNLGPRITRPSEVLTLETQSKGLGSNLDSGT